MRAKLINEIKQNIEGSGLGSIGIGQASVLKGATYIRKMWPIFLKECKSLKDTSYKNLSILGSEITEYGFNCPIENIIVIPGSCITADMYIWIEDIIRYNCDKVRMLNIPNTIDKFADLQHSANWHIAKIEIFKKYYIESGTIESMNLSTYYLIEI